MTRLQAPAGKSVRLGSSSAVVLENQTTKYDSAVSSLMPYWTQILLGPIRNDRTHPHSLPQNCQATKNVRAAVVTGDASEKPKRI